VGFNHSPCGDPSSVNTNNLRQVPLHSFKDPVSQSADAISIGLLNCQSVNNKAEIISDYLCECDLDILFLNETWLRTGESNKRIIGDLLPPGYSFKHKPRASGARGGGVGILHKDSIPFSEKSPSLQATSFESMEGYFSLPGSCIHTALIYRIPPSKKNSLRKSLFLEEFAILLEYLSILPGKLLITGDFNIHWDDDSNTENIQFQDLLSSFDLVQHVNVPTHASGHTLDFVITRRVDNLVTSVSPGDMIADHSTVLAMLDITKPKPQSKKVTFRQVKTIDRDAFKADISSSKIAVLPTTDVNLAAETYTATLANILDNHAPEKSKTIVIQRKVPWFTKDIKDAKIEKRKLEKQWRKSKLEVDRQIFQSSRNSFTQLLNSAKAEFFNGEIDKCADDQKKLFNIVNELLHQKDKPVLPSSDSLQQLLDSFNKFFITKIENIRSKIDSCTLAADVTLHDTLPCLYSLNTFDLATESEIAKIIMSSKNATCSLDPLPTSLLKECADTLVPAITHIVNLSLSSGVFPDCLKHALVKPLLKKSHLDPEELKNYRPVSNLPFLSKVIEKVVASRLSTHMSQNNLHEVFQSAYKANHSTETALVKVQNDILLELDKKRGVILVLLDLSAAFDTIDHGFLLEQLSSRLGIKDIALSWFKSYLSGRSQSIFIDRTSSQIVIVLFGVPQGSVLGPFLFTIYTIPLGDIFKRHGLSYHLYADDSQLYISFDILDEGDITDTIDKVQCCVSDIKSWMTAKKLKLNEEKTEVLMLSSPYYKDKLTIRDFKVDTATVTATPSARNIGVIFDNHLNMKPQINAICRSANYHLRNIGAVRKFLSSDACKKLIHAFVSSRLDYGNALLFGIPESSLKKLQRIFNIAARIVTLSKKCEHITPVLESLHWLPVRQRIKYKIILLTFKALHGMAPTYLQDMLSIYTPSRQLRSTSQHFLTVPKTKLRTYGDRAFSVAAPTLWNVLPNDMKSLDCLSSFKTALKTYLFREAYD
jgi:hypothetical protein